MSACVTVLVLLHYDYNTIRNGPSIRANHYNYNAGGGKGITHDHPVKSVHDNQFHEKLQCASCVSQEAFSAIKNVPTRKNCSKISEIRMRRCKIESINKNQRVEKPKNLRKDKQRNLYTVF